MRHSPGQAPWRVFNNPLPARNDEYGWAIALSGNGLLIGEPGDDRSALDGGSVHLYFAGSGEFERDFAAPGDTPGALFGRSVSTEANFVLIGAPGDSQAAAGAGAAHLFDAGTGALLATLNNPTPAPQDNFGCSAALSGGKAAIGAEYDDATGYNSGIVHLFEVPAGAHLGWFNNPAPGAQDRFGHAVVLNGGRLLAGAHRGDAGAADAGAVYLFDAANGSLLLELENPEPSASDNFGWALDLAGGRILVGAMNDDAGAEDAGSAYLFDAQTGELLRAFRNPVPTIRGNFGWSVALSETHILAGAIQNGGGAGDAGAVFLFDAATGELLASLANPSPGRGEHFGRAVALGPEGFAASAPYDLRDGESAGSAYYYRLPTLSGRILDYILGRAAGSSGLDVNGDGGVDSADHLSALRAGLRLASPAASRPWISGDPSKKMIVESPASSPRAHEAPAESP